MIAKTQDQSIVTRFRTYWRNRFVKPEVIVQGQITRRNAAHVATIIELNAANQALQEATFAVQLASHRQCQALRAFNVSDVAISQELSLQ